MTVTIHKVKYGKGIPVDREKAEKLLDFIEGHFSSPEDTSHYFISEDFEEELDPEDKEKFKEEIKVLRRVEGEEIVFSW